MLILAPVDIAHVWASANMGHRGELTARIRNSTRKKKISTTIKFESFQSGISFGKLDWDVLTVHTTEYFLVLIALKKELPQ